MKEEAIQALDLETLEDAIDRVQNIVLRKVKINKAVFANPTLGLDPHLVPKIRTTLENLTQQDLTLAIAIDICQIKGVDPNRQGCLHQGLHLIFTHLTDPHHPKDNRGQTLIFSKLNIVHVRLLFCSSIVVKRLAKVNLQSKSPQQYLRAYRLK